MKEDSTKDENKERMPGITTATGNNGVEARI